ncbi:MAG: hypothetical protein NTW40_10580 [Acidobacteria bacterium]|nr:hypothetical protein [Acidobacteriota bacterium]
MRRLFLCTVSSMLLAGGLPEELPLRTTLRAETLRLPQNEALGLIGFSGTASFGPWYLGPGLYGAARGQRGGFFTFGLEGGGRGRPFPTLPLELEGGVFVGGGGGASAPQGGGLMLRPHLGAAFVRGAARLGLELSRVTFPNGGIDSTQVALTLAFTSQGLWLPEAATRQSFEGPVRWGERSLEPELIRVEATSASRTRTGTSQAPLTLAGLTSARDLGGPWFSYLAADGAAGGSVGILRAPGGAFTGRTATFRVSHRFATARPWAGGEPLATFDLDGWRVGSGVLVYRQARRTTGASGDVQLITLRADRMLSRGFYLTGEAGSATGGGAGGYSTGLAGVGFETPALARQRLFAEIALGAGGGGGLATGGGRLTSLRAGWRLALPQGLGLDATAGRVRGPRGGLDAPTLGLGLHVRFQALSH